MFYWDENNSGFKLEKQLQLIDNVKTIFVSTAFLSSDGVDILQRLIDKYSVKRENVTVCLSAEFSDDHPSDILVALNKVAKVRIARNNRLFHPKLYYIQSNTDNLLIFGSSNLTGGGFGRNIEFNSISHPTNDEIIQIENFISYCHSQTDELTTTYIEFYKSQEIKLSELKKVKAQIYTQLRSFDKKDDPFTEYTYDLSDFYFKFSDYESCFSRNSTLNTPTIIEQRKHLQDKLLVINEIVEDKINQLNLFTHWDKNNITSLNRPCPYNNYRVDWLGVRYGKRREEVCFGGGVKEPYESFTKHACLQYNIYSTGFYIVLFFAVPNDAWDRKYLKENINKIGEKLNQQVQSMKGHGLVWQISDCPDFNFDTDTDFVSYLKQNDGEGKFSSLNMRFAPNDPKIKTLSDICEVVLEGFKLLKPLYDLIVWRPKNI